MILPGSYANGFAPRDGEPLYPSLRKGCVGAWAPCLGPTGLTLRDWSGYDNHGTFVGLNASGWASTGGRYGLEFDGTGDSVSLGYRAILNRSAPLTIAAFMRTTSVSAGGIFTNGLGAAFEGFSLQYAQSGTGIAFWNGSSWKSAGSAVNSGTWRHVAASNDGTNTYIWLDGQLILTTAHGSPNSNASAAQVIGSREGASVSLNGAIDDVRLYSRVLSSTEIRLLATRRGIAYELAPRRRSSVQVVGGFKAAWIPRRQFIIGGGVQ